MKSNFTSAGVLLLLSLIFFAVELRPPTASETPSVPQGGAWKAFEWWYAQRAYPNTLIPADGYRRGYAGKTRIRELRKSAGTPFSLPPPWESIGPDNIGGRVLSIAIHPESTNTVFAGSASGGLWKSVSGGEGPGAWEYISTGYPVLSVSAIAIDPDHPDTMYIGTGEISRYERPLVGVVGARSSYGLGILRSTDGGNSWDTTGLSWDFEQATAVQKIVINPRNTSTLFAATSEGVYRSTDAGETWSVSNSVLMAMDIVINPVDTTILISSHGNLNSSPDPGLYMTFDGGNEWIKLEGGLPGANFGRTSLSLCESDPSVIYAGISNAATSGIIGLYRSTNGGLTWTLASSTNYVGSQGWYDNIVAVNPANPSTVYCGGLNIHKSSNQGANLPQISAGEVHVDQHAIAFDPTDTNIVYFGCDGGIYKTIDGGLSFEDLNNGFVTTQFYPGFASAMDDSNFALGGLQDNGTLRYSGSPSWFSVWGGDGGWCAIDPTDKFTVYAETQYGRIVRSTNGGFSFSQVTLGLPSAQSDWNFIPPFVIAPSDPDILYAGSRNVYKTTDRGSSWRAANDTVTLNGTNIACIGVSWSSADTLIAATGSGSMGGSAMFEVFASTTGGASWTNVTAGLPDRYPTDIEFDPSDGRVAYLTYSGYGTPHVFRTTDAGQSWSDVSSNLPDIPVQAVAVDPLYADHLYVGTDLGVFRSTTGGTSWEDYNDGMVDAMVLDLVISRSNEALRAATFGNGVYQRPLPRYPAVTLHSPAGGEIFIAGFDEEISWSASYFEAVRIEFSTNGGAVWEPVADSIPASDGSYAWTVPSTATDSGVIRILNADGGLPADTCLLPFSILVDPDVLTGWNMVSVPFTLPAYLKDTLFPTSVSKAFAYRNGYVVRDTLANGEGYWLKFPAAQFFGAAGDSILSDTISVRAGWNMIGSVSRPVPVSSVSDSPGGIILSPFFEFRNGYAATDTIVPGRGYWVKTAAPGTLHMNAGAIAQASGPRREASEAYHNTLIVSDASGYSQTLHFAKNGLRRIINSVELPPAGPGPVPDVRFAENGDFGGVSEVPATGIQLRNLSPPVMISWNIDNQDEIYILQGSGIDDTRLQGHGSTRIRESVSYLRVTPAAGDLHSAPVAFHLSQNFPNPFNPSTTIGFDLGGETPVRLAVYDLSGKEVAVINEGRYPEGHHEISWDAGGLASGIYFYRLTTDGGSLTRKMIFLK